MADTTQEPEWPPADTGGKWLPLPEGVSEEFTLEACGSTVTVTPGEEQETEYQAMHQPDGTIRVEYRGDSTSDVVRESDGARIDELDSWAPARRSTPTGAARSSSPSTG